jgi:hypothetical protein
MNVGQKDNTHLEVRVEMITSVCMNLSMFFFYSAECQELLDLLYS